MGDYKIVSTLDDKSGYSGLDRYWSRSGFEAFYKRFRKGIELPNYLKANPNSVIKIQERYHLRGVQFGNWVTTEDRFNYLATLYICLYDLNKVLKFKDNNLGLDAALGLAFGARGRGRAVAHYEPSTNIINMTRYSSETSLPKTHRFLHSGGVGALAHEYGHFLDYYFGSKYELDNDVYSLTNGSSTHGKRIVYKASQKLRNLVEDILAFAYWDKSGKPSNYYKRVRAASKNSYFVERTEIFARLFEQYIGYKLKLMGIENSYLTDPKYSEKIYLTTKELKEVAPLFDKLIAGMRTHF